MHYVEQSGKRVLTSHPTYKNYSEGYTHAALIDHTTGSVHTGLGLNQLAVQRITAGGLTGVDHTFEEAYFILSGEVEVVLDGDRYLAKAGDCPLDQRGLRSRLCQCRRRARAVVGNILTPTSG